MMQMGHVVGRGTENLFRNYDLRKRKSKKVRRGENGNNLYECCMRILEQIRIKLKVKTNDNGRLNI